jgi:hypothetical protein|tara:strand:+ start:787 stop:1434 length:648 start_codon:yes stop_codon:yes gene_type:complete
MSEPKKIAWQSWNAITEEFYENDSGLSTLEDILLATSNPEDLGDSPIKFFDPGPTVIYTPYGPFSSDSCLKPSNRWDCWFGYTNFDITFSVLDEIENADGVESVKIMGRYTFFIGIGKLFGSTEVKLNIENILTDTKHISNIESVTPDLKEAIDSVKLQVDNKQFWSIFVSSMGEIDYIMADSLTDSYLSDLNKFEDLRQKIGGIIIRSSNEQKY